MKSLLSEYKRKKYAIKKRLEEFRERGKSGNEDIFAELCFCILTPQSKAVLCDKAVHELKKSGLLLNGTRSALRSKLAGVRFPNNKAAYLVAARKRLTNGKGLDIKTRLDAKDPFKSRLWLVKNIKGLGYKEASHFLRNIGLGEDLAILDVHILRNLKRYKVIGKLPKTLTKTGYLDMEKRLRKFSERTKIPMGELDLLLWSHETGMIFK